jgi:poly(A) polymerase
MSSEVTDPGPGLAYRARREPLLRELLAAAREADADLLLVGGAVRDAALRRPCRDLDLAAARGTERLVKRLQAIWGKRGFRFRKRGVTTWRFSTGGGDVDVVDASRRGLRGDLLRRDFTINAVAWDLRSARVVDPLNGLRDLAAGRLRMPRPDAIRRDPVRALRAARFVAELPGFRPSRGVVVESRDARRGLARAASERVRDELNKLLESADPRTGLDLLDRLGLTDALLPELAGLRSCVAGPDRPDVWTHTLDTLEVSRAPGRRRLPGHASVRAPHARRILRWSLLLHDISKPETLAFDADGKPSFHSHEVLGARRAGRLLNRLRAPRADRKRIERLIRLHLRPSLLAENGATPRACRRLVRDAGEDLPILTVHAACDALASGGPPAPARWRNLRRLLASLLELQGALAVVPLPALLRGTDVMEALDLGPGPRVGELLARLRDEQEAGLVRTRREALKRLVEIAAETDR